MYYLSNISDKYHNLPAPVKASFWFTVANVIQRGISLLSTPIFTRILSTEEYGTYTVYQSWYHIIMIFTSLNLFAGVYNNGLTKWPCERAKFTSTLLGLSTTITITWLIIYLCAIDFWNGLLKLSTVYVLAIFVEALLIPAFYFWAASERYDYKYKKLVFLSILVGVASPMIGVVAVLLSPYKAAARVMSYAFVQICLGLFFFIYYAARGKVFVSKKYWAFALSFNLPLIPHYLSRTILNEADRIMIADMIGKDKAAIYGVAYTISMMFTIVTQAINNSFIPYTYKTIKNNNINNLRGTTTCLVIFVGTVSLLAMAFGPEIIRIFASKEYYEARWIVPPVSESLIFIFIYCIFCNIEFYYEKTQFIMVTSSSAAILNILLNYYALDRFGYYAAAYTTLICYMLLAAVHYIAYKLICRKNGITIYNIKLILLFSLFSIVTMILMSLVYDNVFIRYSIVLGILSLAFLKRTFIIDFFKTIKNK